jgi:hypothetical protein
MPPPPCPTIPRHIYRGLLRRLQNKPALLSSKERHHHHQKNEQPTVDSHKSSPIAQHVRALFRHTVAATTNDRIDHRNNSNNNDASFIPHTLSLSTAQLTLQLLQDLSERQRLYEMDRGAEVQISGKEWTRRAAARAGLLPPATIDDAQITK